jgi:uncharacterized protein YcbK (DUF882 family)
MTGEIQHLHPDLLAVLTQLEHRMGFELHITSGYRDPIHNADVGGVPKSEHTDDPAQGADVQCQRSATRYKMLRELLSMAVRRIGIGNTFIHIGISLEKPQNVAWDYYPDSPAGRATQVGI